VVPCIVYHCLVDMGLMQAVRKLPPLVWVLRPSLTLKLTQHQSAVHVPRIADSNTDKVLGYFLFFGIQTVLTLHADYCSWPMISQSPLP
jgi:hypothetical protein